MYKIIGINYERENKHPSVICVEGRSEEALSEVYHHGKSLWDDGDCSKYLIALIKDQKIVDYNRPDYWNFGKPVTFAKETEHFLSWDYDNGCPYSGKPYSEGVAKDYMERMSKVYEDILKDEGVEL